MDEPLMRMQEQLAYLERHVEQLDEVVRGLSDAVDATRRDLARLREETRREFDARDDAAERADDADAEG